MCRIVGGFVNPTEDGPKLLNLCPCLKLPANGHPILQCVPAAALRQRKEGEREREERERERGERERERIERAEREREREDRGREREREIEEIERGERERESR